MKFTKLATSDSFNYRMLNRLQQDCKYFIEHPNLKHLWAQDIDAQIKEMLKIYTSLDPKPEWISEDEIYELADKMKEVYTNKKEANSKFNIGDRVFYDPFYEFVDGEEGSFYDSGILREIKNWPSNNREYYMVELENGDVVEIGNIFHTEEEKDKFNNNWTNPKFEKESAIAQPNKPKPTTMLPDNMQWAWDPDAADWVAVLKDNDNTTPPLYDPNNQNVTNQTTSYMSTVKSACLSKFLEGPQYSKEIKIEAGLIKEGLVKYAGFDFNRGTKYAITDKGLEVLRKASEAEHNEALNEREKLAYMFGFNTDKETTLDTTGKVIKQSARKWTICEADGAELGEVEADSELDAKVKFGIKHPEYADSQSICAKEVKAANKPFESTMGFYTYEVLWQDNDDKEGEFIEPIRFELCDDRDIDEWSWKCEELFGKEWFYGFLSRKDAMDKVIKELNKWGTIKGEIKQVDSLYTGRLKRLHSNYEQITNTKEPYPNPSETPHDDIVLENHDGWVNTANFEDDVRKQFQQPHQKLSVSDRDLEILEKEILDLIDGDKKEQAKTLFDNIQFTDKEAAQVTPEFAKLHSILGEYQKNGHILSITQDGKDLLVSCSPIASYEMKQKFEQLGYECEETNESETGDAYDLPSYTLRIKMK